MSGVEYFGAAGGPAESRREDYSEFVARQLSMRLADEVDRSLAVHLGVPVAEAMAVRDRGVLGPALEARKRELAAEKRALCECGCQDAGLPGADALACEAYMRRRLIPAR